MPPVSVTSRVTAAHRGGGSPKYDGTRARQPKNSATDVHLANVRLAGVLENEVLSWTMSCFAGQCRFSAIFVWTM